MKRRILDTNRLCDQWREDRPATEEQAAASAQKLINQRSDAIVTPVKVEFLAGCRSSEELRLFDVFLKHFRVVDSGRVLDEDWRQAERLARRTPRDGSARQLGDCLIRAIAERLNYGVDTRDKRFPN